MTKYFGRLCALSFPLHRRFYLLLSFTSNSRLQMPDTAVFLLLSDSDKRLC